METVTDKFLIEKFKKLFQSEIKNICSLLKKWLEKWEQLDEEENSQERKKIFDDLIGLCSKIYPDLINLACKHFILEEPVHFGKVKISNLEILIDSKQFIQALKKEQAFSFETSDYKRDNIIHQFRVFLLGAYLLSDEKIVEWIWQEVLNFFQGTIREKLKKLNKKEIVFAIWGLASLFHDCGRGIQSFYKNYKQTKECFEKIFQTFKLPMPDINADVQLNTLWETKKKSFFTLLEYFLTKKEAKWSAYYQDIKKVLEDALKEPKHGIISAFLITFPQAEKLVPTLEKLGSQPKASETLDSGENFKQLGTATIFLQQASPVLKIIQTALPIYAALAVAFHDIEEYWFVTHLTTLLILCDNLQEWKRLTKLGDQATMIFPCENIALEPQKDKIKIIANIFYSSKGKHGLEQEIFKRWNPKTKWGGFKEKIRGKIATTMFEQLYDRKNDLHAKITIQWEKQQNSNQEIIVEIPPR